MPIPRREYDRSINAEIERLIYQVKVIRQEAEGLVWGLSDAQFNWSPAPGQWSMAQCFEHLNMTNTLFLRRFEAAVRKGRSEGILSNGPYTYSFFSRWFFRAQQPPVKFRVKAPKSVIPQGNKNAKAIIDEWNRTHEELEQILKDANGLDLARIKTPSLVTNLLKFNLGMAFWICTAHDRRHLWQARQIRNNAAFPVGVNAA